LVDCFVDETGLKLKSIESQQQENITHITTTLSQARFELASTSSGELVFFAGGWNGTPGSSYNHVDIYNVTSRSWTTATLSIPRFELASTSSGELVFFAGGWNGTPDSSYNHVDIYNTTNGSWSTATPSLNLVIVLQPLLLEILFSLEVVTIQVLPMLLMCLM
jgi:cell wall-associated NlpC family hydrolase